MSLFRLIKITAQEEDAADADDGKIHCIIHSVAVTVLLFCCCCGCCSQPLSSAALNLSIHHHQSLVWRKKKFIVPKKNIFLHIKKNFSVFLISFLFLHFVNEIKKKRNIKNNIFMKKKMTVEKRVRATERRRNISQQIYMLFFKSAKVYFGLTCDWSRGGGWRAEDRRPVYCLYSSHNHK